MRGGLSRAAHIAVPALFALGALGYASDTARRVEWSKNDARLFRNELERGLRAVAWQALNDLVPGRRERPCAKNPFSRTASRLPGAERN
jgi:hypothetical protein